MKSNRKITLKPLSDMVGAFVKAPLPVNPTATTTEEAPMQDAAPATQELPLDNDPRLPPGVASSSHNTGSPPAASPAQNDEGPDEADVPIGQKSNKIAQDKGIYFNEARKLGDSKIKGDNSLFALAELALNGGRNGALVVAKDPNDNDAHKLYERFHNPNAGLKKARYSERAVNNESIGSNVKKIEWFIKLGGAFHDDGFKFFNQSHDVYKSMMLDEPTRRSMKYTAAYEAVLAVIRPFMMEVEKATKDNKPVPTAADMPDDEQIRNSLLKPEKDAKDAMTILAEAYKMIDKANEGKVADGKLRKVDLVGLKDDRLNDVLQLLRDVAADQGPEAEKQFVADTAPPKVKAGKGGRKAKGAATGQEAQEDANNDANAEAVEPDEQTVE